MKNTQKILEKCLESGSTWYKPTKNQLWYFKKETEKGRLVERDNLFTTKVIDNYEDFIAKQVTMRMNHKSRQYPESYIDIFIAMYERKEKITLDTWQKDAVYQAVNNNLFILTGGPGTGKTATLKCIYFCLRNILQTEKIIFTSPTGKAARRITESVGVDAYTLAKKLRLIDETSTPKKVSEDCIIVDEVSMIDTFTAFALFKATDLRTKIILVGDVDQLPSVGYGSVLRDLINANVAYVKLEKTFRQASESGLFANIEQVKKGLHLGFIERNDFKVIQSVNETDEKRTEKIMELYLDAVGRYGKEQVICLTPYRRKGNLCAIRLNNLIQEKLNPIIEQNYVNYKAVEKDGYTYNVSLREGDPVMQLVNKNNVANGDVGIVTKIDLEKELVHVKYVDCVEIYSGKRLGELTLAYAMSTHKSQGSEYLCVITTALSSDMQMLSRNTIYTAITRAKKECIVITDAGTAKKACEIESGYERTTLLCEKIITNNKKVELFSKLFGA